jgi:serine/threonine protein kinase
MKPNHGQRVYTIFEAALRCEPAGRVALLDTLCGDDSGLRAEVEQLLADDERASRDHFLTDQSSPGQDDEGHRPGLLGLRGLDVHILCPHCRNAIELVGLTAADIVCPACGSTFRLERESTASWGLRGNQRKLGRFELVEAVGVGAFGTVYKARDPQLDRMVAIKVPRAGNLATDEDRDRFLREARSVAQLRHTAIVPVHEVGEHDGVPYLVSEFVRGMTLADLLTARRPPPREAARLIADVADALQYAHEQGVIHRDVKPSNILLDEAGRPHLMDFGLAKRDAGEITMTIEGQVLGTPAYMSPEQARGEAHKVDGRSDLYSLGVILYELLTGELPFRGSQRVLLHQVVHDEPRPPRKLNDHIPRDLETICRKAMAKEPARRYATAADLAADLRRFLGGEPIQARPVSAFEKSWRWCRRNPALTSLSVAIVTLLIALVALITRERTQVVGDAAEFNKSTSIEATAPSSFSMEPIRAATPQPPHKLNQVQILTVGVTTFQDKRIVPIPFAGRDAQSVAKFWADLAKSRSGKFTPHSRVLVDSEATAARLIGVFNDIDTALHNGEITRGDMLVVMIVSVCLATDQGLFIACADTRSGVRPVSALLAMRVSETMQRLTSVGCRVLLLLDVIHERPDGTLGPIIDEKKEWVLDLVKKKGAIVIDGSDQGPSGVDNTREHGLFALGILDVFQGLSRHSVPEGQLSLEGFQKALVEGISDVSGRTQFARCYIPETSLFPKD